MVFYCIRTISEAGKQSAAVFVRPDIQQYLRPGVICDYIYRKKRDWKKENPLSSLSAANGALAVCAVGGRRYEASFTVEAAIVFSIIFLSVAAMIQEAYYLHDTITGRMILAETMEKIRYDGSGEAAAVFEGEGEGDGNPRLWLGTYKISVEQKAQSVTGRAGAGDWEGSIEMKTFYPELFLRRYRALSELGRGADEAGD